jgi:hypothetical protein
MEGQVLTKSRKEGRKVWKEGQGGRAEEWEGRKQERGEGGRRNGSKYKRFGRQVGRCNGERVPGRKVEESSNEDRQENKNQTSRKGRIRKKGTQKGKLGR